MLPMGKAGLCQSQEARTQCMSLVSGGRDPSATGITCCLPECEQEARTRSSDRTWTQVLWDDESSQPKEYLNHRTKQQSFRHSLWSQQDGAKMELEAFSTSLTEWDHFELFRVRALHILRWEIYRKATTIAGKQTKNMYVLKKAKESLCYLT